MSQSEAAGSLKRRNGEQSARSGTARLESDVRVTVIVVGDLARSPRIVFHARALASAGAHVDLVGYTDPGWRGSVGDDRIRVWPLQPCDRANSAGAQRQRYGARAATRGVLVLWQLARLLLWQLPQPNLILVQNPPGVPSLAIAWFAARLRKAKIAIDWHNLTSSMIALRLRPGHPLVTAVFAYERFFGRRADVNLFVSAAMQKSLAAGRGVRGSVFRDRPAGKFAPLSPSDRQAARASILARVSEQDHPHAPIVVTATSWTGDEDFNLLLEALVRCDRWLSEQHANSHPSRVIVLITGRGPLQPDYERRFAEASYRHVGVHTMWLEADDYPKVLAAADLGVCLHRSASGVDLPMKILDMFGSGLPVLAYNYGPCLSELVTDGESGLLFATSDHLASQLRMVLNGFPGHGELLRHLQEGVSRQRMPGWESAWTTEVGPILMS